MLVKPALPENRGSRVRIGRRHQVSNGYGVLVKMPGNILLSFLVPSLPLLDRTVGEGGGGGLRSTGQSLVFLEMVLRVSVGTLLGSTRATKGSPVPEVIRIQAYSLPPLRSTWATGSLPSCVFSLLRTAAHHRPIQLSSRDVGYLNLGWAGAHLQVP